MTRSALVSCVATVALATSLALLPGCMKLNQSLTVTKDGSGTANVRLVIDMEKTQQLLETISALRGGDGADMQGKIESRANLEDMKKRLEGKKGVELVSATAIDDPEKKQKGFEAKLKFASLEDFWRAGLDLFHNVKLEDLGEGRWCLTRTLVLPGMDAVGEGSEQDAGLVEGFKVMLEPMMAELELVFMIAIPGTIVETNGTKDEAGTSVTWKQGFKDMLDSKKSTQVVVFKPEATVTFKAFDLRTDMNGDVSDAKPTTPSATAPTTPSTPAPAPAPAPEPAPAPAPAPEPAPVEPK